MKQIRKGGKEGGRRKREQRRDTSNAQIKEKEENNFHIL